MNKQQIILALALLYIASQVVLLVVVGKDLELILISLGVFIASVVIVAFAGEITIGRPVVESVSMRRAGRSKEERDKMLQDGYKIDEEFLKKTRFEFPRRREKYQYAPPSSSATVEVSTPVAEKTPQQRLKEGLIAQAPMFGGIEKLAAMMEQTDDAKIVKMLKRFGYAEVSASEARLIVAEIVKGEAEATVESKGGSYRIKTSLNTVDFYDYIKRCMSGNDMESRKQAPTISGMDILEQASAGLQSNGARAMARLRGVRKGGGVKKCDNCQFYQAEFSFCSKIGLEVEYNDVCDGWTANVAYQEFRQQFR
ncbi:MAG: hypothetical protein NZM06_08790 [Chloroherpetonaceae bacterium]|nr:hypothetical protein [Chloroherpetonaceae bacterium]MDW8436910.1 hypothetical protein [Chloroherpetonaceae bacterium]